MIRDVLKLVLTNGLHFVEGYEASKEAELEAFVKAKIPGEAFDEMAWNAIKPSIKMVFAALEKAIVTLGGAPQVVSSEANVDACVEAACHDCGM
jgi:hypothetical protein